MKAVIRGESATTEQVRAVCFAMARIGRPGQLQVGLHGPKWSFQTPVLSGSEIVAMLGNPEVAAAADS